MQKLKTITAAAALIAALALTACGGGGDDEELRDFDPVGCDERPELCV